MKSKSIAFAAGLCLIAASAYAKPSTPHGPAACDQAAIDAATASITAACPCDGTTDVSGAVVPWRNHGHYVRCVAHATKAAVAASNGALTRRCLKSSLRCSARSTCGKREGVVNCTRTTSGSCVGGLCDDGGTCTSDADCGKSSCSFRPSADACTAVGGVPGTGSCCSPTPIGSPSGAFIDGPTLF